MARAVRKTLETQHRIQSKIDRRDAEKDGDSTDRAMQAGARPYPVPPFPEQHQAKPGSEASLEPAPMYDAPYYRGSGKLEGKVALITGGDSGIGRAVAVLFAREGADIAITFLSETEDADITRLAVEDEGSRCLLLQGDVGREEHCRQMVERIIDEFGRLDILVNNAAFQYHASSLEELTPEHFDATIKTNLYGYYFMAREAIRHMKPGAAIINSGSVTGIEGSGQLLDYSMTKGGIHAFTRALSSSLIPKGIRVNCVAPGPVWTPLNPSERPAEKVASFGANTPMKRPAQPEEIAPAYVFFASEQCSSYITGEILPIIGGY
jgi:NAD(P)-dependent dehydrogenase (short-subunit alcohol dehydrogenase family)